MRKFIIVLLVFMFLFVSGCGFVTQIWEDDRLWDEEFYKYYDAELDEIALDVDSINKWVHYNITYTSDQSKWGIPEYWQPPHITLEDRTGDCEDYTILFMYLVYYYFDVKCPLLVQEVWESAYHAISEYEGYYYDPTGYSGKYVPSEIWNIVDSISYDTVMMKVRGYSILTDIPYIIGGLEE